jgi:hypothetical protein
MQHDFCCFNLQTHNGTLPSCIYNLPAPLNNIGGNPCYCDHNLYAGAVALNSSYQLGFAANLEAWLTFPNGRCYEYGVDGTPTCVSFVGAASPGAGPLSSGSPALLDLERRYWIAVCVPGGSLLMLILLACALRCRVARREREREREQARFVKTPCPVCDCGADGPFHLRSHSGYSIRIPASPL